MQCAGIRTCLLKYQSGNGDWSLRLCYKQTAVLGKKNCMYDRKCMFVVV